MIRRISTAILLLFLVLMVCGCWDRREPEELLLVDVMAVDIVNKAGVKYYQISLVSSKPSPAGSDQQSSMESGGGGGTAGQWIASSQGRSMEEAMRYFSTRAPRYVYLEHNTVILIGEDLAKAGVSDILDFMIRKQEVRLRNYLVVTKGSALALLSAVPEYEDQLADELHNILDRGGRESDYFLHTDLNIFSQAVLTPGIDPWAPLLHAFQPPETDEAMKEKAVLIEETALFHSDKLVGFLDKQETQGIVILSGEATEGALYANFRGGPVAVNYKGVNVSRKVSQRDGMLEASFSVAFKGVLAEIHAPTIFSSQDISKLESLLAGNARGDLQQTISKCQQLGADVLGIGRAVHIQHPEIWKKHRENWQEVYQNMKISINVSVEITGTKQGFKSITPNGE